jgi:L,D-transpeptidase ErfK/SrfK
MSERRRERQTTEGLAGTPRSHGWRSERPSDRPNDRPWMAGLDSAKPGIAEREGVVKNADVPGMLSKQMNKPLTMLALYFASMSSALAAVYELPPDGSAVVGTDSRITVRHEDKLFDVARRYGIGYPEIVRANPGADIWAPGDEQEILLPVRRILPVTPHEGIVVNLPEHRLYYYPKLIPGKTQKVITYPVSIGRMDWHSPLGQTSVIAKERHPNWYPPESIRKEHAARGDPLPKVVPPGPKNPLGEYKIRLAVGDGTYEIHGTNNPVAVGLAVTHGCIRMYPEDVAALFEAISVGTKVWLINEPVKIAYVDGKLLMEVHPPVDGEGQTAALDLDVMSRKLRGAVGEDTAAIHWDFARKALEAATGVPTVVGVRAHVEQAAASTGVQ